MALEKVDSTVQKLLSNIHTYNNEYKKWEGRTQRSFVATGMTKVLAPA
jgi:hypothetical protein